MDDALMNLKGCPICGGKVTVEHYGFWCPRCDLVMYQRGGESLMMTAERWNSRDDKGK